jgi:hypothetical protein
MPSMDLFTHGILRSNYTSIHARASQRKYTQPEMVKIGKNLRLQLKRNGEPAKRGILSHGQTRFQFLIHSAT